MFDSLNVRPANSGSGPKASPRRSYIETAPDTLLFTAVAALVGIGLVMIYSASSTTAYEQTGDTAFFVKRQAVWLVVGLVAALGAYRIDYHRLKRLAPYILIASFAMLTLVLVPHIGLSVNGARRWIGIRALSIQPSEFAKLGLILYLAAVLAARGERITSLVKGLIPLCFVVAIMAMLILKEPDLGTASLLGMFAFAMFFAAGARLPHLIIVFLATVPVLVGEIVASAYERARILAFLNPWKDPENTGFHIVQSLLALGSGGLFGVGLGESHAKFFYLPEQYTDFIFSILGEELGLFGALVVIVLFVILTYRAIKIAIAAPDRFGFLLVVGCTALISIQAFINIGVVTSSWPVTGVPLPFISFGGSSLIVNLVAVALIANVGRRRRVIDE